MIIRQQQVKMSLNKDVFQVLKFFKKVKKSNRSLCQTKSLVRDCLTPMVEGKLVLNRLNRLPFK